MDGQYFCAPVQGLPNAWPNVVDMSDADLKIFAAAMNDHISHDYVTHHYRIDHSDAEDFFYGHHRYVQCVENALAAQGINLPVWDPVDPAPTPLCAVKPSPNPCFLAPNCAAGWLDANLTATSPHLARPDAIMPAGLCKLNSLTSLFWHTVGWHNRVHMRLGGTFSTFDAPAATIFMPWHNFIDKVIFGPWLACKTATEGEVFIRPRPELGLDQSAA